jgi:STE24 endopeptidase
MSEALPPARAYARLRYRLVLLDLACSALFLLGLQVSGMSHGLARWTQGISPVFAVQWLAYLTLLGSAQYVLLWPLHFYTSFRLEHRFGLSRLSFNGWLVREAKHVAVGSLLSLVVLQGLYALLRQAPVHWPLYATVGWVAFSVVLARVFPTWLLPIFYKTSPVQDDALQQRLSALCARVGLPVLGVFRFDLGRETRKANAALAGLGRTRRVLLSDTLLQEFPAEEIEGVLAHELAHHRYRHIVKLLSLSAAGSWLALSLTPHAAPWWLARLGLHSLADPAGFPALMLWFSMLGVIGMPLQHALSRALEWQADRFAAATTAPGALAAALRRLSALNLADPQPPRWVVWLFYDHPPITERIRAAESGAAR